jgi:hypothetical protein
MLHALHFYSPSTYFAVAGASRRETKLFTEVQDPNRDELFSPSTYTSLLVSVNIFFFKYNSCNLYFYFSKNVTVYY